MLDACCRLYLAFVNNSLEQGVGLVLSGGGARGLAHLGVYRALIELKVPVKAVSGTSAGALAGAFIAAGAAPAVVFKLFRKNRYFGWRNFVWGRDGLFTLRPMEDLLKQELPETFSALPIPLHVTCTDVVQGTSVHLSEGPLYQALLASAAVPLVFEPQRQQNRMLVDGGVLNNFPVEPLLETDLPLIGVHVNRFEPKAAQAEWGKFFLAERCFHLAISGQVYQKQHHCALFLDLPLGRYHMFDTDHAEEIYQIGYEETMKALS